jgi:putative FmdB family regulatory protein
MPIYEYRRPDGTTFELQQSFSDAALTVDPDTGVPVERVLHAPAVHFKGKGFYNTDYGTRNRQRETAAAAEGSSSNGGSAGEGSGEGSSSASSSSAGESSSAGKSSSGGESTPSEGKAKGEKGSKDPAKSKRAKPLPATS